MTFVSSQNDPFYALLSKSLQELRGALSISLTDRRGDIIAKVIAGHGDGVPSDEELSVMHVYGQLTYQQAPTRLSELAVERGSRRWQAKRLIVDDDLYDLWLVCHTDVSYAATSVEMSNKLSDIEAQLISLLRGQ